MSSCLVCRSDATEDILDLGPQPVSSHFMAAPDTALVRHPVRLAVCTGCGVLQLEPPFPFRDLVPPYDWITYREPESHLDAVVDRLRALPVTTAEGSAIGLSFKDATTLARLKTRGFPETWTLDPRGDLGSHDPNSNIESVPALLTPGRAAELAARRGPANLVIARHVLEHAENPWRFMTALGALLAPGGTLVIEVPDCRANLERQDYTMIWEEHSLYFTPETLPQVLAAAGCEMLGLEIHPFPFEDVIVLYARKADTGAAGKAVEQDAIARNIALARDYGAAFEGWCAHYRQTLDRLIADGPALAAYGAGHLTCAFLNFHDLADRFAFVVDDTPEKQDLYLPGSGLPIVARSRLRPGEASACIFGLAPEIEDKVIANNPRFAAEGGGFYSMFADSTRSIRAIGS